MKKNGFVSTTLIYTFFVIFLALMIFLVNSYSKNRFMLNEYKDKIKNDFAENNDLDINLYFMVYNEKTKEYEIEYNMPKEGYIYKDEYSYCKNGSVMVKKENQIEVRANKKDSCYAYFEKEL